MSRPAPASSTMGEGTEAFTVAAIGDLHVSETRNAGLRELFAEMSDKADAVVLCGDLTDLGKAREAELLADDLRPMVQRVAREQ